MSGDRAVGGLIGHAAGSARIAASYSTASVECRNSATGFAGGLAGVGAIAPVVTTSWSAGAVTGACPAKYGLVDSAATTTASYWDATASGIPDDADHASPEGLGTADLQRPTSYTGIYATWNIDLDGDYEADDPWDFGTSSQYPSLKWRGFDPAQQFALPPPAPEPEEPGSEVPANRAPEATATLADAILTVGGRQRVDLASAFRDLDGDELRYAAQSSNPAVALASVQGSVLVLEGVAPGAATVTATATDPAGLAATQTLTVTVGSTLWLSSDGDASLLADRAGSAAEGGTVRLVARLSAPREMPTAFSWRVLADADPATADADADEHGDASGAASIAAGETSAVIAIAIADDAAVEPAREWFVVEIASEDVPLGRSRLSVAVLEGVCDRTPTVASALAGGRGCEAPTAAELAQRRMLALDRRGIAALGRDDLAGLSGLRTLMLRGNALQALPAGLLAAAPNLRYLLLSGNRLSALREDEFAGVAALRELDLADNALETLPGGVLAGLSDLRRLRLDGNALQTLPNGLFAAATALRSVRLGDNPGAPFALRVELRRTDAAPGEPGPATIRAELATGAPFAVEVALATENAELAAADGTTLDAGAASLAAGETAGDAVQATAAGPGIVRVAATVVAAPETICDDLPCWEGIELSAGDPLTLFALPPTAGDAPTPAPLFADALRLPLESLASAGSSPLEDWQASSSDPAIATVYIVGGELLVEPVPGAAGEAEIAVTAVDALGLRTTVRFTVQVEFYWPPRSTAGWRTVLETMPTPAGE